MGSAFENEGGSETEICFRRGRTARRDDIASVDAREENGVGKNGRIKILLFLCACVCMLAGMPELKTQAQETQPVSLEKQGDGEKKLPGYEQSGNGQNGNGQGSLQELPDAAYLAAWQAVADSFSTQAALFWQQQEAGLSAAGQGESALYAAGQKAEAVSHAAALQNALDRLACLQTEGEAVRQAARQQVEEAAAAAVSWFDSSVARLASLQPVLPGGETAAQGVGGTGQTVSPEDGSAQQETWQPQPVLTSLTGKRVSILGDSITTFRGYIPEGYTCYYPRSSNDITDVNDTWWMKVINRTGMQLLVNGSWSGSAVCGDSRAENSSAGCSNRRLVELMGADGTVPDVILVYMGANDFFHPMNLGVWSGQAAHRTDHYILDFTEAYELMLQKLQGLYPNTQIYCMTLIEANSGDHPRVNANGNTIADYNRRIREIAAAHGIPVIDVHECGIPVYELNRYTDDGTHPNREGAEKMAVYVTNALLAGG